MAHVAGSPNSASRNARLALTVLGTFKIHAGNQPLSFATDAARALLAYLAVEADEPHRRESLATLLWPDQSQSAALTNLRQTLARMRRGIPDAVSSSLLTVTRQTLEIDAGHLDLDSAQFERLIAACASHPHATIASCRECLHRLEQACALYGGDFLDGVFAGNSQLFDEWIFARRERFRQQALAALHTLADHFGSVGDYEAVRQHAARQLELEPWREEAHRQMMRAMAYQSQRPAALAQYRLLQQVLAAELGVEPDTETRVLYERIRDGGSEDAALGAPAPANNLPAQLTPFIGREEELTTIHSLLDDVDIRLLTLVGAGGMGKTRLALETAYQRVNRYPDGVFFVPLAPVATPEAVASAIAAAVGLSLTGQTRLTLPDALRGKVALLVLDNFEHLLDGAEDIVGILKAAPDIQILVTSRERLNVVSEHAYVVQGMEYGSSNSSGVAAAPAPRLFEQCVRRLRPEFALQEDNAAAVTRICELVEGMPLGLELAAAWTDMLPLDEIAREIESSVDFLSSDWRDVPERHRSMRAVFEGSWRSLDETERQVFRQLSVFQGGFGRDAAQAVTGASLRGLVRLGHKSLLHQQGGRYEIHELLRQFGAEQLDALPDERAAVEKRHSAYFLTFVAERQHALDGYEPQRAAREIQAEIDNIETAWMSAIRNGLVAELEASAFGLWRFHSLAGSSAGVERLMRLAAERLETNPCWSTAESDPNSQRDARILSKLRALQAAALVSLGDFDAAILTAESAIELGRSSGEIEGKTFGLLSKAQALAQKAQYAESEDHLEHALRIAQGSLQDDATAVSLELVEYVVNLWLGAIAIRQSYPMRALQFFERSLAICQRRSDRRGELHSLTNLGNAALLTHDYALAGQHYERALQLAHELNYRWGEATAQQELGEVARLKGDPEQARQLVRRALVICREIGERMREAVSLAYLARLHAYLGDDAGSREHLDRFHHIIETVDVPFAENWGDLASAIRFHYAGDQALALEYARRAEAGAQALGSQLDQADALVVTGRILAHMTRLTEAADAYQRAIDLCDRVERAAEVIDSRAGLALIALAQDDPAAALAQVETIQATQAEYPDAAGEHPFAVQLACYRVLDAVDDPRAAVVLEEAHRRLLEYADGFAEGSLRRSFLKNVAVNRELQLAYADCLDKTATGSSTGSGGCRAG